MKDFSVPSAYRKVLTSPLKEIGLTGTVLEHKKSGARVICLPSEDENKVFYIAFRTPPIDDSGLPHILEHSVLCGSDKYPLKDPFMELNKSSLNTYLNAMTYPDKTISPVASCNDKDFANLMDVYMDAVLHPLIHSNENIFRQEGWRYELDDPEGELSLNGIVYSEMKGAFSSPDETLERYALNTLYPDTAYRFESGGDPEFIPTLSYEAFCGFHKKLYHPVNSYIFLYGNMDMEERLNYLDEAYLKNYDRIEIDSFPGRQAPFEARRDFTVRYPIAADEDESGKSYYSMQWSVGDIMDSRTANALDILDTVLLQAPGAPLAQALMDAGMGKVITGGFSGYTLQPQFNVTAKMAEAGKSEEFAALVRSTLDRLSREGLNKQSLAAAISSKEFQTREADYGGMSKGLIYGINILNAWLYDGEDPFLYLRYEDDFAYLREHMEEGCFETLIREKLLDNPHCSLVEMNPEKGKDEKDAAALREKLAAYKKSLSAGEIEELIRKNKALKQYQEEEDSPEAKRCVPKLTISDLKKEARKMENRLSQAGPAALYSRSQNTAGIAYATVYFSLENLKEEQIPWLGLLKACFGGVSTAEHDYRTLYDLTLETTGGIFLTPDTFRKTDGSWKPYMAMGVKALYEKMPGAAGLLREMSLHSLFTDGKRLKEILDEQVNTLRQGMMMAGHAAARLRASSYYDEAALFSEKTGGLSFFRFINDLNDHFEEKKEEIGAKLAETAKAVFTREGMMINLTCEEKACAEMSRILTELAAGYPSDPAKRFRIEKPQKRNEGIRTTGAVSFSAAVGSFQAAGPYTGALKVLQSLLSMDYLWQRLRVLGGAYGAMCQFGNTGLSYFASYRDPNIASTKAAFEEIPAYLKNLELPEEVLNGLIISTIGGQDIPYTPSVIGQLDFRLLQSGLTQDDLQKERDAIIGCRTEDLRALAPYMEAILKEGYFCTFGSGVLIDQNADLYLNTENL